VPWPFGGIVKIGLVEQYGNYGLNVGVRQILNVGAK